MNQVCLVGRLAKDVELKTSQQGKYIAKTTIAIKRDFKNAQGTYDADFLPLIAFGNTAEFMNKYLVKGSMVAITGKIQTGSYTNKEGKTVYTTDIIVNTADFVESKKAAETTQPDTMGFTDMTDSLETELPFT